MRVSDRRLRRLAAAGAALAAVALGLTLASQSDRSGAAPGPNNATLTIQKGGDRETAQGVDGLAGATFDFFAGDAGTPPAANASPTASCVTAADGQCSVDVPGRTGGGTGNNQQGYWIRERTAPAGFAIAQQLGTATTASSPSTPVNYNLVFTGNVANNTGRTFPEASTGSTNLLARGSFWADLRDNPALPGECGLNIALLIDNSGSIGGDAQNVKNAANGFVDALTGTPSQIALYTFSTNAQARLGSTPVSDVAGANTVKASINSIPAPSGSTNWDQGLFQIAAASTVYDAVIFLTDGNPTVYGPPPAQGPSARTRVREVENGVFSANAIKAEGTKIVTVGVGAGVAGNPVNLRAVSGPVAGTDYVQTDYAQLAQVFRDLALKTCSGTVSVVKKVIPPNGTVADAVPAGGWTFTGSSGNITPNSGATAGGTGAVSFTANLNGAASVPVTLTETLQSGFAIAPQGGKNATCTANGQPATSTNVGALGFTVDAVRNTIVSCTVYNLADTPQAQVRVKKTWVINGESFTTPVQPPSNFVAGLVLTNQDDPQFGPIYGGYEAGQTVNVDEVVDDVRMPPGCTNVPSGDIGDHDLVAGINDFVITNTVTCITTLTLIKEVENPYGPAEPINSWTLSAYPPGQTDPIITGVSGANGEIEPGITYSLGETDVPGYKQEKATNSTQTPPATGSWHCVLLTGNPDKPRSAEFDGLNGTVTAQLGQNVECKTLNTAQIAKMTLVKQVNNTHGGTAGPADWTLEASPLDRVGNALVLKGVSGSPAVTNADFTPLTPYVFSESDGPAGYHQVGTVTCIDNKTGENVPFEGGKLSAALDQTLTCTFVNEDEPKPTIPPTKPPLPVTGDPVAPMAVGGSMTVLGGLVLVWLAALRRRRIGLHRS